MIKDKVVTGMFENFFQLNTEPLYVEPEQPAANLMDSSYSQPQIAGKKKNYFPTIFNAVSAANLEAVIKVNTGLYTQNLQIQTSGLKIQSNQPTSNVVLISQQRPTILIDLPRKEDKVCIEGLKFAHTCEHAKHMARWPSLKAIRETRYRPYKLDSNVNTSILIKRGTVQIDQCRLSLAAHKDPRHLYASIIVQDQGSLVITRSELAGNLGTIGIYCNGGKVTIRECSFKQHGGIAVWMNGGPSASLILKNSIMTNCGQGLVLNGPFSSSVQNNVISECSGLGIITLFGNSSNLINNEIRQCKVGIEIENSCPKVMKNNLVGHADYGICSYSKMNEQCWPVIRFNLLAQNKKGGLLVWGSRNISDISNNTLQLNQKVGIKLESNCHPHILLNQISATFGSGVHVGGGATTFLQKNEIHGSVNCNLVLEGPSNIDNYIYSNHIHGARGNGVLLLHCQKFLVAKNNIHNNYNGLLAITSVVNLEDNRIWQNKCNGLMLLQDCELIMTQNVLERNRVAGMVCRSTSKARMNANRFGGNRIEVVVQTPWSGFEDMEMENQFQEKADIRVPGQMRCQLI